MKILHVPYTFYPDPVGGTEVYVESLAQRLQQLGIKGVIAAPGMKDDSYEHKNMPVHRYATGPARDLRGLYGEGDETAADAFSRILTAERPDIVHLHAVTRCISLRMVRGVRGRGIPVVFTYHTPTITCQRGTMMRWGKEPCHGLMDLHTCARCTLHGLFNGSQEFVASVWKNGSEKMICHLLGSLSPDLGAWLGQRKLQGGIWTALRMTELIRLSHLNVRELLAEVDHVVAVSKWVRETLMRNGVPEAKITLSRQGVIESPAEAPESEQSTFAYSRILRIAFLGRLDPTKGVHILIQAFRSIASAPLRLHIYGVAQGEAGVRYEHYLRRLAAKDERIEFRPPLPRSDVVPTLRDYDLLAVPSQGLETGPLAVMEAFAAAIPVIGSRMGGIAELVRDGVDGILIEAADVAGWSRALRHLSEDRSIIEGLRRNIRPPKRMSSVAKEMVALYRQVLGQGVVDSSHPAIASST